MKTSLVIKEMRIKTTYEIPLYTHDGGYHKKKKKKQKIGIGKDLKKLKCYPLLTGMWNDITTVENGMVIYEKIKNRITI